MNQLLWQPTEEAIHRSQLWAFMTKVSNETGLSLYHYQDLYDWSIHHSDEFWSAVAEFTGIEVNNYAQHLLKHPDETLAILAYTEEGLQSTLTRAQLYQRVQRAQAWLKSVGVTREEVVAAVLPNVPEAIIFMLATTALGAIWTSCSPDFGLPALIDRFSQVTPKVLITSPGYIHKGKQIDLHEKNAALHQALPSVQAVHQIDQDLVETDEPLTFESLPFDHPAFILYSSGTTGLPKCIVHGHGGTLIQHMKELILHTDLKAGDRLLYLTTCGWMMWNWMVSALGTGASLVLYEGSPLYPRTESLLDLLSQAQVTVFGTSAKFLSTWEKAGVKAQGSEALSTVRTILSTGSPLMPSTFEYVYRDLKSDLCLSSISGGTDIISCFALGCPVLPVYSGELQCRGLGMAVEIWDESGHPVVEQMGELVCVKPFPSMPLKFWSDPDDIKYRKAYFSRFEGVWTHGDYAMLKTNGGLTIFGRSDAVLNPGGVRIGTAEIYRQVETLPAITEALAVGLNHEGDQDILLFVILAPGYTLTEDLIEEIKLRLRQNASPRHVPKKIIAVKDFPRTINGKISEIAVTKILNHQPLDNLGALANPEVLVQFEDLT